MTVKYTIKGFDELSAVDIYHILRARSQVFVIEQQCLYQDIDELDFDCMHLVAHMDQTLVGYCRIIPPAVGGNGTNPNPRIGRVLVLPDNRHQGVAREMMVRAIKYCHSKYGKKPIQIAAQTYLIHFYQSLGFEPLGQPYDEDGLEHIDMILNVAKRKKVPVPALAKEVTVKGVLSNLLLFLVAIGIIGLLYLLI